jgi:hypothetical protein
MDVILVSVEVFFYRLNHLSYFWGDIVSCKRYRWCPWDSSLWCNKSCDRILSVGDVVCCSFHRNRFGRLMPRKVGIQIIAIFDKHRLRR